MQVDEVISKYNREMSVADRTIIKDIERLGFSKQLLKAFYESLVMSGYMIRFEEEENKSIYGFNIVEDESMTIGEIKLS